MHPSLCACADDAGDTVDYIVTGAWSKKAYEEAQKFGLNANLVAKGDNKSVPARDTWKLSPDAKYVHYCDNETIGGETLWPVCCCRAVSGHQYLPTLHGIRKASSQQAKNSRQSCMMLQYLALLVAPDPCAICLADDVIPAALPAPQELSSRVHQMLVMFPSLRT